MRRKTPPAEADVAFRKRVEELGGWVQEPLWLGFHAPHRVICPAGHRVSPRPSSIAAGRGVCRMCGGTDKAAWAAAFRAWVRKQGGTVLSPTWEGSSVPCPVRCRRGHEISVNPRYAKDSGNLCRICTRIDWTVFYVVRNDRTGEVKFGVTGHARARMMIHRRDGFSTKVRLLAGLPEGEAARLEDTTKECLRLASMEPVRGWEYFSAAALPVILGAVDTYAQPNP